MRSNFTVSRKSMRPNCVYRFMQDRWCESEKWANISMLHPKWLWTLGIGRQSVQYRMVLRFFLLFLSCFASPFSPFPIYFSAIKLHYNCNVYEHKIKCLTNETEAKREEWKKKKKVQTLSDVIWWDILLRQGHISHINKYYSYTRTPFVLPILDV